MHPPCTPRCCRCAPQLVLLQISLALVRQFFVCLSLFCTMSSAAAASSSAPDVITLTALAIEPSTPVPIDAALKLTFAFDSTQEMADAFWDFKVRT